MHACMLPDPCCTCRNLSSVLYKQSAVSSISRLKTKKILHVPGTQDQDVKDVDRWMKIQDFKQQVILVLLYVHLYHVFMHNFSIWLSIFNLHIVSSLSQKTLLTTTYLSICPLSLPRRIFTSIKGKLFLHNILFSILYFLLKYLL